MIETRARLWKRCAKCAIVTPVPAPYTFVALTLCIDDQQRVLMVRESRPDCRGQYYVPAGRGFPGEDPLAIAWRTTREKTGIEVQPIGIVGLEHQPPIGQYPGQVRTIVIARARGGQLKTQEDDASMEACWVAHAAVRDLKLRSKDFLPWLDDAILGQPFLPATSWRALGSKL